MVYPIRAGDMGWHVRIMQPREVMQPREALRLFLLLYVAIDYMDPGLPGAFCFENDAYFSTASSTSRMRRRISRRLTR